MRKTALLERLGLLITLVTILVGTLLIGHWVLSHYEEAFGSIPNKNDTKETWGMFGDYVGGLLNPTFAFMALLMLFVTILLQRKALSLTRQELEKTTDALEAQNDSLKLQNFENSFYNLLNSHKNSAAQIQIIKNASLSSVHQINGKQCFKEFHKKFQTIKIDEILELTMQSGMTETKAHIERFLSTVEELNFSHYLNEHLDLLDLVKRGIDQVDKFNKVFYINILKRQYTPYELFFIFLHHLKLNNNEYIGLLKMSGFFDQLDLKLFNIDKMQNARDVATALGTDVFGHYAHSKSFDKLLNVNECSNQNE